jgi:hypothetical protein
MGRRESSCQTSEGRAKVYFCMTERAQAVWFGPCGQTMALDDRAIFDLFSSGGTILPEI